MKTLFVLLLNTTVVTVAGFSVQNIHTRSRSPSVFGRRTFVEGQKLRHDAFLTSTTLAHTVGNWLTRFRIGPAKLQSISENVGATMTAKQDLFLILLSILFATPLARRFLEMVSTTTPDDESTKKRYATFLQRKTILYLDRWGVLRLFTQASRIVLSVYVVDILAIAFDTMGFTFPAQWRLSQFYVRLAFSTWAVRLVLRYKKLTLCRLFGVSEHSMGRVDVLNRLLSASIVAVFSSFVLEWMSIKMNNVLTTLFAVGSAGTLALTLASQGLVTQLVSGLFLALSDKMYVGDYVRFGDDTSGKVVQLGWMETVLRRGDNSIVRVPNAELSNQKVVNLSRIRQSQVKQTLRFHYDDVDKLPDILNEIKQEIKASCPRLIVDGTRPFRVFWTNFNEDHLEVVVNSHFSIAPLGDAYWINRQNVLLAIYRVLKRNGVELAELFQMTGVGEPPEWRVLPRTLRYNNSDNLSSPPENTMDDAINGGDASE